jgi:hypothetical protein
MLADRRSLEFPLLAERPLNTRQATLKRRRGSRLWGRDETVVDPIMKVSNEPMADDHGGQESADS